MPAWNDLLAELEKQPDDATKNTWLREKMQSALADISRLRSERNIIFYASAFLNKPQVPPFNIQLTHEEINGFMSVMYGMKWERGLTLLLHTPGGVTNAAETIVSYLHSKFTDIEVIIPTFAMSAGTMIALAANRIIMGRQSQLGPIDPQIPMGNRLVPARAIVDQFERARKELGKDIKNAHLWAPILQTLGPASLQEAQYSLDYSERMVRTWLEKRMFAGKRNAKKIANTAAAYFNKASLHKSHGRRIDRDEARAKNIVIEDLEASQDLQEAVLTAYHLITIIFEKSSASKLLISNYNRMWIKNLSLIPVSANR
jgi:hypothetical protein